MLACFYFGISGFIVNFPTFNPVYIPQDLGHFEFSGGCGGLDVTHKKVDL